MKKIKIFILASIVFASPGISQNCSNYILSTTPNNRFVTTQKTVNDKKTGLMWTRCSLGQNDVNCSKGNPITLEWKEALKVVRLANINSFSGYNDWRLPNMKELSSIIEVKCHNPAINTLVFPNTVSDGYWSSSPYANYDDNTWIVSFDYGHNYHSNKAMGHHIRLVRDITDNNVDNSIPTNIFLSNTTIRKDANIGALIGNLSTVDTDKNDNHQYSIVGGNSANYFKILGNQLLVKSSLASIINSSLNVSITTTDNHGESFTKIFTINLASPPISTERFIKIDGNGQVLSNNTSNWSCVIDNEQGLMWEAKQGGSHMPNYEGLHDADDRFSWGNTASSTNNNRCYGYNYTDRWCTTDAFIERVNNSGWCGHSDWRLPTIDELYSLVNQITSSGAKTYSTYFPTLRYWYWSSTEGGDSSNSAWVVYFGLGHKVVDRKGNAFQTILVRNHVGNHEDNLNKAPTDIQLSTTSIDRNIVIDNLVSILSTIDSDSDDTHTYSITGGSGATYFKIRNHNELHLSSSLAQVTENTLSLLIRTTDSKGNSYEKMFTLRLNAKQEALRFIKLDSRGKILSDNAKNWSCTKDNSTNLTWEIKQSTGVHKTHLLTWYNSNSNTNGGYAGDKWQFNSSCRHLFGYCNTESFVNHVNNIGLCGHYDWRFPTRAELEGLIDERKKNHSVNPMIHSDYFKFSGNYWTSEPTAKGNRMMTWTVNLTDGVPSSIQKSSVSYGRLVRDN